MSLLQTRRTLLLAALGASAALPAAFAQQSWPSKPVTLIVPFGAGSALDAFARVMGEELAKAISSPVIVENVNGGGGTIATARAARARADGYTLLMGVESTILLAQLTRPAIVQYDGLKDLVPVLNIATSTLVLVGKPELPVEDAKGLLQWLASNPKGLSYGTTGVGSSLHLVGEQIVQEARVPLNHVPYSVSTQIITDVAGNQLDLAILPVGTVLPFVQAKKVKAFGVASAKRYPSLPDVPAFAELPALSRINAVSWWGLFAPTGLDGRVRATLESKLSQILAMPHMVQRGADLGVQVTPQPGMQFADALKNEFEAYRRLITARNIKVE